MCALVTVVLTCALPIFVEEIDFLVQFQLANVLQMLLAGQRQQPLGLLDVIHRLLGRLGVGLVSFDSARLLELLASLLKTWVIDLGRHLVEPRSEERRVGKECVSTCRSRWAPYH